MDPSGHRPNICKCADCEFVAFAPYDLEVHLEETGHKKPGALGQWLRFLVALPLYMAFMGVAGILLAGFIVVVVWYREPIYLLATLVPLGGGALRFVRKLLEQRRQDRL